MRLFAEFWSAESMDAVATLSKGISYILVGFGARLVVLLEQKHKVDK